VISLISGAYFVGNAFFANEYKQVCIIVFLTSQVSILVTIPRKLGILLNCFFLIRRNYYQIDIAVDIYPGF